MSGILGTWNLDGQPVDSRVFSRMSASLRHRGGDDEGWWIDGPVGLGCELLRITPESQTETQPFRCGGIAVVFDGRLDNRDELLPLIADGSSVSSGATDAAFVAAAYRRFGTSVAERLAGDFALGIYDSAGQRLILIRDALGIKPLYYGRIGNVFVFASEIRTILAHPQVCVRPNEEKLSRFLATGLSGGAEGTTFFRGISYLLPAHTAILEQSTFSVRRYWDFDAAPATGSKPFVDYVDAFREQFELSVRRRLRSVPPVGVFVSGGLDSSAVLAAAELVRPRDQRSCPPVIGIALTTGGGLTSGESAERDFLVDLERHAHVSVQRPRIPVEGFLAACRNAVQAVEAPLLDSHWPGQYTALRFVQVAREYSTRVVLTGDWAEPLLEGQGYLVDLFRRFRWGTAYRHLNEYGRWMLDSSFNEFGRRFVFDFLRYGTPELLVPSLRALRARPRTRNSPAFAEVIASLQRSKLPDGDVRNRRRSESVGARIIRQRLGSESTVLRLDAANKLAGAHGLELAFPFLDRDLVALVMKIPGEIRTHNGVPRALLREAMRGRIPERLRYRKWKSDAPSHRHEVMLSNTSEFDTLFEQGSALVRSGYTTDAAMRMEGKSVRGWLREYGTVSGEAQRLIALELWLQTFVTPQKADSAFAVQTRPVVAASAKLPI